MRSEPLAEVEGVGLFGGEEKDAAGSLLEEQSKVGEDVSTEERRNVGEREPLTAGPRVRMRSATSKPCCPRTTVAGAYAVGVVPPTPAL